MTYKNDKGMYDKNLRVRIVFINDPVITVKLDKNTLDTFRKSLGYKRILINNTPLNKNQMLIGMSDPEDDTGAKTIYGLVDGFALTLNTQSKSSPNTSLRCNRIM